MTEAKEIEEGHGMTDVSCVHGSRWIWWPGPTGRGKWEKVVWCSNCDCSDPPRPFKRKKQSPSNEAIRSVTKKVQAHVGRTSQGI